jgi:hypothetical protein
MMTRDGFQPDRPPIFLSEHAEETGQPDIEKALNRATISSRILKTCILAVTATAIGIAILSVGDPVEILGNVTALWSEKAALQPDADPSTSTIQSIAGTQDLPATTTDAPTRDEIAAAVEPAEQSQPAEQRQADIGEPINEALFKQFQAWAAEEEARAQAAPAQPAQAAPVPVVQDAPAQARPTKKHRRVRSVQNARAEIRSQRNHRARVREEQDARGPVPPVADPRYQDPSVQNPQTPSLLQSLGLRN